MRSEQGVSVEQHGYGKLRIRPVMASEKLNGVVDRILLGWHECNDRYQIVRDNPDRLPGDYLVILTTDGQGAASVGGERYRLTPGTVMIFPRGVSHTYGVPKGGRWEFYWMHVSGVHCSALLDYILSEHGRLNEVVCMDTLTGLMERILSSERRYSKYEVFAAKTLSELLFLVIEELERPRQPVRAQNRIAANVAEYIEKNSGQALRIEEIGAQMYLSTEHIIRVFKAETGMTPYQYLKQVRMKRACLYLEESGMSIEEIACAVGYRSASAFIAQFREKYGITPKEYRNHHTKAAIKSDQKD